VKDGSHVLWVAVGDGAVGVLVGDEEPRHPVGQHMMSPDGRALAVGEENSAEAYPGSVSPADDAGGIRNDFPQPGGMLV
jgi:hypothetical protein